MRPSRFLILSERSESKDLESGRVNNTDAHLDPSARRLPSAARFVDPAPALR